MSRAAVMPVRLDHYTLREWTPAKGGQSSNRRKEVVVRRVAQRTLIRCLGSPIVERAALAATRRYLRIITYHRITSRERFRRQMEHLARHYRPVDGDTVSRALLDGFPLSPRSVWVTFDDGDRSVIDIGQSILDRLGISATMFVCPGLIGTTTPFWWQTLLVALEIGIPIEVSGRTWTDSAVIGELKRVDDATRRGVVDRAAATVQERIGGPPSVSQLREAELQRWVDAGHGIANHTWDHPVLDRCEPEAQERQVIAAHEWLGTRFPDFQRFFAYPNGNWAAETEATLQRCGYQLAFLFDQRLTKPGVPPLRVSRLRISADAERAVFRARLSGAWSAVSRLREA